MKNLENKTQNIEIFCNSKLSFTHTHKKGIENFQKNKKKLLRHSVNMFKITEKNIKQLKQ